jgi:methionyl-tRNA formyltransferase
MGAREAAAQPSLRFIAPVSPGRDGIADDRLFVACGDGAVELVDLQKAGGKPLGAAEFLRGAPVTASASETGRGGRSAL